MLDHARSKSPVGITVSPIGGLGNQLFIFSAGYAAARRLGVPLYVDTINYASDQSENRNFELDAFKLNLDVARFFSSASSPPHTSLVARPSRWIARRLNGRNKFVESSYSFDPRFETISPATSMHGYFQSWRYFTEVEDELREQVGSLKKQSEWYRENCSNFEGETNWCAIHIRRGDYQGSVESKFHGIIGSDYYSRATAHIKRIQSNTRFVLFSDDEILAQHALRNIGLNFELFVTPRGVRPAEVMLIMSQASYMITANSSFSWWAAWLGSSHDKVVVCPRPWFRSDKVDTKDLLPDNWLSIGHSF